jgi:hypothetical protein
VACALFSCLPFISRRPELCFFCDRVAGTLGSMRSGVAQASSRVLLSCVSCPCVRWARDRGTASLCSFGLVVLGLGPGVLRLVCIGLRGDPCLVGLGDGAVVFGHQG